MIWIRLLGRVGVSLLCDTVTLRHIACRSLCVTSAGELAEEFCDARWDSRWSSICANAAVRNIGGQNGCFVSLHLVQKVNSGTGELSYLDANHQQIVVFRRIEILEMALTHGKLNAMLFVDRL